MGLRARMGLAAGVAVALAVIAVAVSAYAGTSSELHGQLDQSLQSLTSQAVGGASGVEPHQTGSSGAFGSSGTFGPLGAPGSSGVYRGDGGDGFGSLAGAVRPGGGAPSLGLAHLGGPAFGGAAGVLTGVRPNGSSYVLRGARQYSIPVTASFKALAARGRGRSFTDLTVRGTAIRVLALGVGQRGALLAALPLSDVNRALSDQLLLLVVIAAGGIALAAFLGLLVARTALAPIARFTRQTEAIAARPDRLDSERLDVHGNDELARLAQTFNRTLDALEGSVRAQRNLVADASHELRTPIATIRANLQLMADEHQLPPEERAALRRDVIEELDELTALVSDVVELARGSKPAGEPGDVRLDSIVRAAVERTQRRAPQLTVESELEPTLVRGQGERIARAVANLLDNAVKWSAAGGVIDVILRDGQLSVRDHGSGFAEEDLPFVFDRFHRSRAARAKPGSGLGLAIVRQAADAHGGSVTAANAPGGGALMCIGFGPASTPAQEPVADAVRS